MMERRDLGTLTLVVTILVAIDALATPVILLAALAFAEGQGLSLDEQVGLATLLLKLPTMVAFGRWIYVAGRNLVAAGYDDLSFTPGSRIWWFAVPIACFFKPFQGMRELWNASRSESDYEAGSTLVAIWWALWLLSGAMAYVGVLLTGSVVAAYWGQAVVDIALAVATILLVRGIADAQTQLAEPALAEVFA